MKKTNLSASNESQKYRPKGLAGEVTAFALFLRGRGYRVFQSSLLNALESLKFIDLSDKKDFMATLRANLTAGELEWSRFPALFEEFWSVSDSRPEEPDRSSSNDKKQERDTRGRREVLHDSDAGESTVEEESEESKEWMEGIAYSPVSKVEGKDFGRFNEGDIRIAQLALKKMMEPFRTNFTHREKRARKPGALDFSRIMKKSMKTDGWPVELFYIEKKRRLKRLVVLADVSGSMDKYARFVLPFILGLRRIGPRAEVFVFSTSLARVTAHVRHLSMDKALERISKDFPEWSGGTRIGYSLNQFNHGEAAKLLSQKAVVVILSDGWDLGGKELLKREMEHLSRNAHRVLWLNPLAGDPAYEPMSKGMKTVFPYIDYVLPVDSLQSLERVGRLLSRIMIH